MLIRGGIRKAVWMSYVTIMKLTTLWNNPAVGRVSGLLALAFLPASSLIPELHS